MLTKARKQVEEMMDRMIATNELVNGCRLEELTISHQGHLAMKNRDGSLPLTYRGIRLNVISHT